MAMIVTRALDRMAVLVRWHLTPESCSLCCLRERSWKAFKEEVNVDEDWQFPWRIEAEVSRSLGLET